MTWYIDSDNYACAWIDDDDFTLLVNEAGVPHSETFTLNTSLDYGERLEITLEKNSDTLRATLEKGNEIIKVLEYETSIDAETEGDLYFGYDDVGLSLIPDFMISNVNNTDLDSWDKPKIVIKKYDQSTDTDVVLTADSELYAYLPPNSIFEIELNCVYICDSATPDIRVSWGLSGNLEQVTKRIVSGAGSAITNLYAAEEIRKYAADLSENNYYGGLNVFGSFTEKFLVKTGVAGGKIEFEWAQMTSSGDSTTVKAGSYLKITKIEQLQQNL
jgi:hypothetical protein